MGTQIIKQPNRQFALFSSICDGFTAINCTREELIDELTRRERERIEREVDRVLKAFKEGTRPYHGMEDTFTQAMRKHRHHHGGPSADKIKEETKA